MDGIFPATIAAAVGGGVFWLAGVCLAGTAAGLLVLPATTAATVFVPTVGITEGAFAAAVVAGGGFGATRD